MNFKKEKSFAFVSVLLSAAVVYHCTKKIIPVNTSSSNGDRLTQGLVYNSERNCRAARLNQNNDSDEQIDILFRRAVSLEQDGQYTKALPYYQQALEIAERVYGHKDFKTIKLTNALGSIYELEGNYSAAEVRYKEALANIQETSPDEQNGTATILHNLARLLLKQERNSEAKPFALRAVQLREASVIDAGTATSYDILAKVYEKEGRFKEAEILFKKSLEINKKFTGQNSSATASSMNNLGLLYYSCERNKEAEELLNSSLRLQVLAHGKRHPLTSTTMNNLALVYAAEGRNIEAQQLLRQAYLVDQDVLGITHPNTLSSVMNIIQTSL
jgi:tetratricopeptide (TPR) repeat protein